MCRLLDVQSHNYYSYQKRQTDKPDDLIHQEILEWVKYIAKFRDNTHGERRIQKVLNTLSFPVSRRKTAQLIKEAGVWVRYKKKYKATTNSDHKKPIYDNMLKQDSVAQKPDQAYVQDITYISTSEG
jgi:putative transposase